MEYYNSRPTSPDGRRNAYSALQDDKRNGYSALQDDKRNGYSTMQDDRRNGYSTKQADNRRNGFIAAEYDGTPYIEVAPPEAKPPPPGLFSYFWTIPGSYLTSWLSRRNTTPRLEWGPSSAGGSRADVQRPPTYNRGQDSEFNNRSYGNFESRGLNGAHLGKVDNTSRGIDDHERFPARNEAHGNDHLEELRFKEKENRIKYLDKCLKDLEIDFRAKTKSYYLEKMRADDFEKEIRECQERLKGLSLEKVRADALEKENRVYLGQLRGLHSEKTRADALEKEIREGKMHADALEKGIREHQGKLQGLQSEKMRADNLEREKGEIQAKLQMKEREVGELQLKLQAFGAAAAALEVRDAELKKLQNSFQDVSRENLELKKLQNSFQDVSRENQDLKSWRVEQEKKLENTMSSSGELNTKVSQLTTSNVQLEKQKQQLTTQVQEQVKRIQELKQQASVLEVKMGAKDSEAQSLRERLREERDKSSKLSDALQQKNVQIEELRQAAQDLGQKNKDLTAQAVTAENGAQGGDRELRERALKAQFSALQAQVGSKESETQNLKARLREELENTARLSERLQQCGLEIDDLKHQIRDLARGDTDSIDFLVPPPPPPPRDYTGGESFPETEATPYLLDGAVQRVHEVAGIFARLLMKAMDQGKIDGMAVARNNFVRSISVGKAAPLKYVLEAITCKLLFQGFEHECFDLQDSTSGFLDMEQQRMDNFREYKYLGSIENPEQLVLTGDNLFTHFCRTKLENLSAAIPEIKGLVQEIIARTFEHSFSSSDGSNDVASFFAAKLGVTFVKLAVCVWQVHKLVFSFNPVARIFRVSQSEKFVEKYMESVIFQESESDEDDDMVSVDISRVDFMVVPGFFINRIVIRSRVFVVTKPLSRAFWIPNGS
jgi:hypothetical protein